MTWVAEVTNVVADSGDVEHLFVDVAYYDDAAKSAQTFIKRLRLPLWATQDDVRNQLLEQAKMAQEAVSARDALLAQIPVGTIIKIV